MYVLWWKEQYMVDARYTTIITPAARKAKAVDDDGKRRRGHTTLPSSVDILLIDTASAHMYYLYMMLTN